MGRAAAFAGAAWERPASGRNCKSLPTPPSSRQRMTSTWVFLLSLGPRLRQPQRNRPLAPCGPRPVSLTAFLVLSAARPPCRPRLQGRLRPLRGQCPSRFPRLQGRSDADRVFPASCRPCLQGGVSPTVLHGSSFSPMSALKEILSGVFPSRDPSLATCCRPIRLWAENDLHHGCSLVRIDSERCNLASGHR